ncbi:MAG: hypothetical protein GWN67_15850 [Phycisphaerae bacterium]|nr:hypothetical protein [Phycisphaerae bacterium]NIP51662.1 hypothetical protein [Phycisphaerae bacterium]NIS50772.1 hypothetical protein [Phycisphaerae bacterium]NIU08523.1 hypothetical protein [Phycisphaerae bacterium]NIU57805.1 hypothetical protein [Phycisphaerae bacterium]
MMGKPKYGKIVIVVFITILIWIWSDLALDEDFTVSNVEINIVKSNPQLWVSFDDAPSVTIEQIVLKGPLRKIANIRRKLEEERLEIDFDATKEKMNEPASYPLPLLPFLKKDEEIRRLGLKVESCKPETLSVKVVRLVSRPLDVKCVDEDGNPIGGATVDPAQVDMLVPEDWGQEKRIAEVMLTRREIEQARGSPIEETPYIRLAAGQTRQATQSVEVTLPPEPDRLSNYTIKAPTLGISLSPTLQGKYYVEVTNPEEVLSFFAIRATPEAERAYRQQTIPRMTLYILDKDTEKGLEEQSKKVVYNFPPEFVRKGEIELKNPQQPAEAKFMLIPISSTEASKVPPG